MASASPRMTEAHVGLRFDSERSTHALHRDVCAGPIVHTAPPEHGALSHDGPECLAATIGPCKGPRVMKARTVLLASASSILFACGGESPPVRQPEPPTAASGTNAKPVASPSVTPA